MASRYGEKRGDEDRIQRGMDHDLQLASDSIGAELRAERERLGWTLAALSEHLRIRLPFLQAIEDGKTAGLPGAAYAVGFIRTYATALGLDPEQAARRYRAETGEMSRNTQLEFPAPVPERGVPALVVALVGVVVAIGAYAAWYRVSGNGHPAVDAVQQVPERLAALVPERPPPPPAPPAPEMQASPAAPRATPPSASGSASAAVPNPAPAGASAEARPGSSQTSSLEQAAETSAARGDGSRIVLHAKTDAWMQVRERAGHELLNRVLRAGETWPVPPKANLLLSTGNAAGTELVVDGVAMASLGGEGVVRHDLPLDPDTLRTRLGAAATPSPVAKPFVSPHNQ